MSITARMAKLRRTMLMPTLRCSHRQRTVVLGFNDFAIAKVLKSTVKFAINQE